ncbi:MAG: hypothetical protein IPO64_03790 [Bacteroidetes bacterium]|jgi:uncharacterized membrane protein|nr:hypothetical protein [Bacteroidota bacterium]MBP7257408.1 hypothetical protein [Chitinophagales bacterium]MBK9355551.1 hypothetical protein [Bacteroidota bacterium]MBK9633647.1 hypothetical protein [Bacteroidota bacterium]MBL0288700.1 hypothetical protein [Bacteroidota bacterium]
MSKIIGKVSIIVMAILYFLAGLNHFRDPQFYLDIMPSFFPIKEILNFVSGGMEVVLAIGLFSVSTRKISAYLIILLLISFFVVHIAHLFQTPDIYNELGKAAPYLRIVFQFVFIYWAYKVGQNKQRILN